MIKNWKSYLSFVPLIILCGSSWFLANSATLQARVKNHLIPKQRRLLSTALGDVTGAGFASKVIKVRTTAGLAIEVFQTREDGTLRLLDRIPLPGERDGYFHFRGQATNLALDDVDGDNRLEILAPTFDERQSARLNVYTFDPNIQRFHAFNPPRTDAAARDF